MADWDELLEEQRAREERADAGGGRARQARQRRLGRRIARERIAALVDAGSFSELGRHVLHAHPGDDDAGLSAHRHPGDGLVCGLATVDGRPVAVYAHDPTVLRGALGRAGADKLIRLLDLAGARRIPVVALADSDGARVAEVLGAIEGYGAVIAHTIGLRRRVVDGVGQRVAGHRLGGEWQRIGIGDRVVGRTIRRDIRRADGIDRRPDFHDYTWRRGASGVFGQPDHGGHDGREGRSHHRAPTGRRVVALEVQVGDRQLD